MTPYKSKPKMTSDKIGAQERFTHGHSHPLQGMVCYDCGHLFASVRHDQEHSVILTAHRKPFYNREKRDPSPIGKESRWAQHRLSRYPRSAQVASGRVFATNSTLALTSGWIGYKSSCPIRKPAYPR